MADVKWIKIVTDIFDDEKIQLIEALPSADTIIVIWFKILCLAGKSNNNGLLVMNNRIPYTEEMLSTIFRRKVTDVRMALNVFEQYGMIEIIENTYFIPNWDKHQSLDYYEKKKAYDREYRKHKRDEQKRLIEDGSKKSRTTVVLPSYDSSTSYSNSFSTSNNNITNLNILLNSNYKYKDYYVSNNNLLDIVTEWMSYKDERTPKKQNRYTESGMKSLLTEIVKYHKEYGDEAVTETINHTIAGQWQGIVWDWMEKKFKKTEKETEEHQRSDRPSRWASCPDDTWQKLKPFAHDDGSFDWSRFNPDLLTDEDRAWMRSNDM